MPFFSSKGRFLKKISGANFCFWVLVLGLCFLVGFCLCFCFIFGGSLPKVFGKILLMSGLLFFGFFLSSFGFFVDVVFRVLFFFLSDRDQVVTGHPLTRNGVAGSFSCLCPAAFLFRPFWPCVLLLGGFSGRHSGPRAFLGFSLNLLRPFSWDARRQGFSCAFLALFSFSPCVLFCGHAFSRKTGGGLTNPEGSLTHPED